MEPYSALFERENLELIKQHQLFRGLDDEGLSLFLRVSEPEFLEMEPGEHLTFESGSYRRLGIVVQGNVRVLTVDYGGNKTIVNVLQSHGSVGTMQFMADYYNMLFEIVSDSPSKIVMFNPKALLETDPAIAVVQHKILGNLLATQRQLFITISEHLVCLSQKNIRDKVLRYLQIQSENNQSYEFDIPLSREDLAAYLAVDRASLSRSLGELRRDGVLDFRKNHFKLLDTKYFIY